MDFKKQFGDKLRSLRKQKGWSQEELAERCGLHRTYVSSVERGERNPTLRIIQKIAHALEVHPSTLLEGGEIP